ncbi:MAG TPA: hypothetical protein VL490_07415 [Mucilaginibacter sp.]|jgi:phosphatidylinositol glycan class B|nr:hypothetical protein [Mucilaginibacter sp.]
MTQPNNLYRNIALLGLLLQLIAAWFSLGYNHVDEHYQVFEFCNYKLGLSPASQLPWEYAAHCRSGLQPLVAYIFCKTLLVFGLFNPYFAAFLPRLLMGVATWLVTCRVVKLMLPQFANDKGKNVYIWCSFLLWFIPYLGVRFSAENIGGVLFFAAITLLPGVLAANTTKNNLRLIAAGLLFGFSFFIRLQMAFALIALCVWLICYAKWPVKYWIILILAGITAIGLSVIADYWLYGIWTFSPYNYYVVNIVNHVAVRYGIQPWWNYFSRFFLFAGLPVSLVLFPLFFIGIWKNPKHVFSWICVVFIVAHSAVSHKEFRFLFPIILPFIFLVCKGFDGLTGRYSFKNIFKWLLPVIAGFNIFILIVKIFTPATSDVAYYRFIYNYAQKQPTTLVCIDSSPYTLTDTVESNFYKSRNMNTVIVHSTTELNTAISNARGKSVLVCNPELSPVPLIANYKKTKLYSLIPDWMPYYSFYNYLLGRRDLWSIYRLD